jgi:hypothetical protein
MIEQICFYLGLERCLYHLHQHRVLYIRMTMGRVEQYHTHTRIVDAYKILPIPVPMGMNLYPCPYPAGTHTHWVPNGWIKYYTSYSLFYFHR